MTERNPADPSSTMDGVARLTRPAPLRIQVREQLRELIIGWVLAPGEHLVETELADRLGVSRVPVREALHALHSEGWVELRTGRGAFVRTPSATEVDEIFTVRAALESEAAALAATRTTAAATDRLRRLCEKGRAAVTDGKDTVVAETNSELHTAIAELAGVGLLRDYISRLNRQVRWLYRPLVPVRGLDSWTEHDAIVDALERRDAARAATLMRAHSERTRDAYRAQATKAR